MARGGRIAEADKTQLHFLLAAGCFDASAVARLKKFSKLDVDAMLAAPLPLRRSASAAPDAAAVRSAEAKAAAKAKEAEEAAAKVKEAEAELEALNARWSKAVADAERERADGSLESRAALAEALRALDAAVAGAFSRALATEEELSLIHI